MLLNQNHILKVTLKLTLEVRDKHYGYQLCKELMQLLMQYKMEVEIPLQILGVDHLHQQEITT